MRYWAVADLVGLAREAVERVADVADTVRFTSRARWREARRSARAGEWVGVERAARWWMSEVRAARRGYLAGLRRSASILAANAERRARWWAVFDVFDGLDDEADEIEVLEALTRLAGAAPAEMEHWLTVFGARFALMQRLEEDWTWRGLRALAALAVEMAGSIPSMADGPLMSAADTAEPADAVFYRMAAGASRLADDVEAVARLRQAVDLADRRDELLAAVRPLVEGDPGRLAAFDRLMPPWGRVVAPAASVDERGAVAT